MKIVKFIEFLPLIIFLILFKWQGIMVATGALIVATAISVASIFIITKKIAKMQLFTLAVIVVFGGLTLYLNDPLFIKIKPTIILFLFAIAAFISILLKKPLFALFLAGNDEMRTKIPLDISRKLTMRLGLFFMFVASLNEVIWRTQSEEIWVYFKVFGISGLSILFMLIHIPVLLKYLK